MTKRRFSILGVSIFVLFIWITFSGIYSSSDVYAQDPFTQTSINITDTSIFPISTNTPTSAPTPNIPTSTNTPVSDQIVVATPDVLGTISALKISLTELATNREVDRSNIQSTLSSFEVSISGTLRQQEYLFRMQLIGFCVAGILILGMIIYTLIISRQTASIQEQMKKTTKPSLPQSQISHKDARELERRLDTAEQEALNAKKISQETHSQMKNLELKIQEQDRIISSLKSKEIDLPQKQETRNFQTPRDPLKTVVLKEVTTEIKDNLVVNTLHVYNQIIKQEGEKFIPLDKFVANLIESKLARNESEVYKILEYVEKKRPGAVRIETIRGKVGKHIAFFKEYL
jgi:hypothetical protein